MKPYEKPKLVALSLNGNERLCGYCSENGAAHLLYQDSALAEQILLFFTDDSSLSSDGVSRSDFETVFDDSSCSTQIVGGFCKFTTSETMVAWS